jgi:hypothetical protein
MFVVSSPGCSVDAHRRLLSPRSVPFARGGARPPSHAGRVKDSTSGARAYDIDRDGTVVILRTDKRDEVEWIRDGQTLKSVSLQSLELDLGSGTFVFSSGTPVMVDGEGGAFIAANVSLWEKPPPIPVPNDWRMVSKGGIVHVSARGSIDWIPLFENVLSTPSRAPKVLAMMSAGKMVRVALSNAPGLTIGSQLVPRNARHALAGDFSGALVFADVDPMAKRVVRIWHFEDSDCVRHGDHHFASPVLADREIFFVAGRPTKERLAAHCGDTRAAAVMGVVLQ